MSVRLRFIPVVTLLWAASAWACPVCGQTSGRSALAYASMTAFLSLTPLLLIAGVIGWVYRRTRTAS